ncbi:MAG TPA: methyltransferase domain-containing protein [Chitinophagaceae bacterium]|nr:methyltransferase domain-containing protein [Chitinophagaceae bacterium]
MNNKLIRRDGTDSRKIFDNRTLDKDYPTLKPVLREGMCVLDVGCGTGAITKDIAKTIGPTGKIIGIDNTERFILSGTENYGDVKNLRLIHVDLFEFEPDEKFDLIISARTLQWLSNVPEALLKMKSLLKSNGILSILDYNHTKIEWCPTPPASMRDFYNTFLKWRSDAGMNNQIADDLLVLLEQAGFKEIEQINSDEHYEKGDSDFQFNVGIWSKVANLRQMVEEGYLTDEDRLKAIAEYNRWIENEAISMTMKLNDVRGRVPGPPSLFPDHNLREDI